MTTLSDRQREWAGYFMAGFPEYDLPPWPVKSAAASTGNCTIENNCLPVTTGRKDHGSDGGFQWRLDRLEPGPKSLKGWCAAHGLAWDTIKAQAAFHMWELKNGDAGGMRYDALYAELLAGSKPLATLTANVCVSYERPSEAALAESMPKRIAAAEAAYDALIPATSASPAGQARAEAAKAKKQVQQSNTHAGITVVAGGLVAWAHSFLDMPAPMAWAGGALVAFFLFKSLASSVAANNAAAVATARAAHPVTSTAAGVAPSTAPVTAPVAPAHPPEPPATAVPEWVYSESLGIWVMGYKPPPPPPPPMQQASNIPAIHFAPEDLSALAAEIVRQLQATKEALA